MGGCGGAGGSAVAGTGGGADDDKDDCDEEEEDGVKDLTAVELAGALISMLTSGGEGSLLECVRHAIDLAVDSDHDGDSDDGSGGGTAAGTGGSTRSGGGGKEDDDERAECEAEAGAAAGNDGGGGAAMADEDSESEADRNRVGSRRSSRSGRGRQQRNKGGGNGAGRDGLQGGREPAACIAGVDLGRKAAKAAQPVADVEAVCKDLKLNNGTKANKKAMVADIEMELKLVKEKTLKIEAKKRAAAKMNLLRMNQVSFFLLRWNGEK